MSGGVLGGARVALAAFALAATSVVAASAVGCLPDLAVLPADAGASCGDGVVDFDAGEACDPGASGAAGCTRKCALECPGVVDRRTGHCYWVQEGSIALQANASRACRAQGGHLVTYASADEVNVVAQLGQAHWVGLQYDDPTQTYGSVQANEPGWARTTRCRGCYANTLTPDATAFPRVGGDGGAPGVLGCVVGSKDTTVGWYQLTCAYEGAQGSPAAVCEREPPGRTSEPCGDRFCVRLRETLGRKRYVYVPTPVAAEEAQAGCARLGAGARLVVLESREEREALVREVSRYATSEPHSLWIGLTRGLRRTAADGGAIPSTSWIWEDDTELETGRAPVPWGDREPRATVPARAYLTVSPNAYDTQLAHADDGSTKRGYVCETLGP